MSQNSSINLSHISRSEKKLQSGEKNHIASRLPRASIVLPAVAHSYSSTDTLLENIDFDSRLKYLDSYKNLTKIAEMRKHHLQPQTPISTYLLKLSSIKLAPVPMGLIKKHGVCEKLDTSNLSMGDQYAAAMAEGLKFLKVRKIILKNNGLSDAGASRIIKNLDSRYSTELNIAENHIGALSISAISALNGNSFSKLQIINLESNNLCDKNVVALCNSLSLSDRIKELILSGNKISDEGALAVSNYIRYTTHLHKLDISWNSIRGAGGKLLFRSLAENESIRVFDISWNSIGSPSEECCSKALSESLATNFKLIHLDISNNMLSKNDCEIIGEALKMNHTILGLHIEGNHGDIDPKGYIFVLDNINTYNSLNKSRIAQKSKSLKRKNKTCWICQKWNEVEFKWRNGKSGPYGEEPIMVHLDFDEYAPTELQEQSDSYYKITRMCPPGPITFFFTLKGKFSISAEYSNTLTKQTCGDYEVSKLNVIENYSSPSQLWYELKPKARPRDKGFQKEERPPWDFSKSVFRDYVADNPDLLNECFSEDMERSKIKELTRNEYNNVFDYLKPYYFMIKETYKALASEAWLDWDIWLQIILDFTKNNKILNQKDLKDHDIESIIKTFKYWNSTSDIYFARYQFLELIVRISIMKYIRNRTVTKIHQAIKLIFKNFLTAFDKSSSQHFRTQHLYLQTIDKVLYKHHSILITLYYYFAHDHVLKLDGFYRMMSVITNDYKAIKSAFILAKETSVTYSYYDDSLKFVEFLEAFVRVVHFVKQNTNVDNSRLDLFIDEVVEVKLEPFLQKYRVP